MTLKDDLAKECCPCNNCKNSWEFCTSSCEDFSYYQKYSKMFLTFLTKRPIDKKVKEKIAKHIWDRYKYSYSDNCFESWSKAPEWLKKYAYEDANGILSKIYTYQRAINQKSIEEARKEEGGIGDGLYLRTRTGRP